jgi:putative flavoprotein involved in K+ transport
VIHPHPTDDALDVVVIGAGQSGLAIGWHLARQQRRFVIVDGAPEIGHVWRSRWDSLRLFSPAQYDGLPGMDFPAAPDTYPGKDDVASYLASYADRFALPVLLGHRVTRLTHHPGAARARFTVHTRQGPLRAHQVVVATGPFQQPLLPELAADLGDDVVQVHSTQYRNPGQLPEGPVLVVGGGNSGLQIAEDLVTHARFARGTGPDGVSSQVHLGVGSTPSQLPQRFLGRDLFWWLTRSGLIHRPATSQVGRRFRARGEVVIGTSQDRVAALGVHVRPRVVEAGPRVVGFADGSRIAPAAVVWATGFDRDYAWIDVPGVLPDPSRSGTVAHQRGVTDVTGLYFLGLPWQHTRGSALLGFVRHDAAWIADRIAATAVT